MERKVGTEARRSTGGRRSRAVRFAVAVLAGAAIVTCVLPSDSWAQSNPAGFRRAEIWYRAQRVVDGDPAEAAPPPADPEIKAVVRRMLTDAREWADRGDVEGAIQIVRRAQEFPVAWGPDEPSPATLLRELISLSMRQRLEGLDEPSPPMTVLPPPPLRRPADRPTAETQTPDRYPGFDPRYHPLRPDAGPAAPERAGVDGVFDRGPPSQPPSRAEREPAVAPPSHDAGDGAERRGAQGGPMRASDSQSGKVQRRAAEEQIIPRSPSTRQAGEPSPLTTALVPTVSFLAGLTFCLILLTAALVIMLRRLAARAGTVFRVELVNGQIAVQHGPVAVGSDPLGVSARAREKGAASTDHVAELSDLLSLPIPLAAAGPTLDEKRRQEEEQARQREQAMMKQILAQNLELREKILERQGTAA